MGLLNFSFWKGARDDQARLHPHMRGWVQGGEPCWVRTASVANDAFPLSLDKHSVSRHYVRDNGVRQEALWQRLSSMFEGAVRISNTIAECPKML